MSEEPRGSMVGKSAQDIFGMLLNARVWLCTSFEKSSGREGTKLCPGQKNGPKCYWELKQEKSCPGALMAVETGKKDQSEEPEEGDGCRIANKNSFCFLLFVLLPLPAIVFMRCFLIGLFRLPSRTLCRHNSFWL